VGAVVEEVLVWLLVLEAQVVVALVARTKLTELLEPQIQAVEAVQWALLVQRVQKVLALAALVLSSSRPINDWGLKNVFTLSRWIDY
jgi:hypothetical protein